MVKCVSDDYSFFEQRNCSAVKLRIYLFILPEQIYLYIYCSQQVHKGWFPVVVGDCTSRCYFSFPNKAIKKKPIYVYPVFLPVFVVF